MTEAASRRILEVMTGTGAAAAHPADKIEYARLLRPILGECYGDP